MATSGTITGGSTTTYGDKIESKITWKRNSYSIEKNTSNVTFTLSYKKKDDADTYGTGSWKMNINGTTYTGSSQITITNSGHTNAFSKTVDIAHNADGTKSFTVNANGSYIPGTSFTNTNCSGTVTLDAIPRASSFDSVTSSVGLGGTATIKITAKSSSFYHKATWTCGAASATQNLGKVGATTQKSYTYTIPTGWSAQMPNATSKTASVKIQTYSDSEYKTAIGSAVTKNFTVTVPNNTTYNPTVSLTTTLGNPTNLGESIYVQGKTTVTLAATGSSKANATIKSYVFKRASTTLKTITSTSTSASMSETTNTTGSVTYSVTITDSRGRTATASKTITVNAYSNPSLVINDCYRSNSNGTKNTTSGTYFYIKATFSSTTAGDNSITTSTVKYKLPSDSSWRDGANLTSGTGIVLGNGTIDTSKNYDVYVSVTDKVGTVVSKKLIIPTIFVTMDFKAGGNGIAIGKIAEEDYLLDVGMEMRLNTSNGNEARMIMLSDGYNDREVVYSNAGNIGFRDITDNHTWLLRIDSNNQVWVPGDKISLGEVTDTTTKDIAMQNSVRKVNISLNANKNFGFYDATMGSWVLSVDENGRFSAPKSIVHGSVNIKTTAANTPTSAHVPTTGSWPFAEIPTILVTPYTGVPGTGVTGCSFTNPTKEGCDIVITRTGAGTTTVHYLAFY